MACATCACDYSRRSQSEPLLIQTLANLDTQKLTYYYCFIENVPNSNSNITGLNNFYWCKAVCISQQDPMNDCLAAVVSISLLSFLPSHLPPSPSVCWLLLCLVPQNTNFVYPESLCFSFSMTLIYHFVTILMFIANMPQSSSSQETRLFS